MIRIVPHDEAAFIGSAKRHIKEFAIDEGLNWQAVNDSMEIEECSEGIALQFWWIKNNVMPTEMDKMNTMEERERMEKEYREAEEKNLINYNCQCGMSTNIKVDFENHKCEFSKKIPEAYDRDKSIEKVRDIITMAADIGWVMPKNILPSSSYPLMQLSEVEKCLMAMVDENDFEELRKLRQDSENKSR